MSDDTTNDTTESPPVPSLSEEAVARIVQESLAPLGNALGGLHSKVTNLESQLPKQPPQPKPGDDLDQMLPGLSNRVQQIVVETNKQTLAPLLQPLYETTQADLVAQHQTKFDAEFGEGAWDKYVKADVDQIIEALPHNQRVSARHLNLVVDGLKGRHFDQLTEARAANRRAQETAREAAAPLLGPGRAKPSGTTLTEDEQQFLQVLAANGRPVDKQDWIAERDIGNTEDDWRTYFAARKTGTKSPRG